MGIEIVAKFELEEPDSHRLPALDGSQSITGIARSLVLVTHFAATGTIRHRAPFDSGVQVYIEPPRRGSLEAIYQIVSDPGAQILGGIAISVAGAAIYDLTKTIFSRSVGASVEPSTDEVKDLDSQRGGDLDALVDAVEPALKQAHKAVNGGATNILIIQGDKNVVNFNSNTKNYIERSDISKNPEIRDVSIGSFNANSNYGRAYFHDLNKTVPFKLDNDANFATRDAISYSLYSYARGFPSDIEVKFFRITSPDGRTKSIIITKASKIEEKP